MFKKILTGTLVVIVVAAAAFSIYNTGFAKIQAPDTVVAGQTFQGRGGGQGGQNGQGGQHGQASQAGQGSQWAGSNGTGTSDPNPQNGLTEWVTYSGIVSSYAAPTFTLTTADGQTFQAEPGNASYLTRIGLALQDGDAVTVTGFVDANGGLALKSLTLDSTGQTFTFRDDLGRPLWAGGQGGHNTP